MKILKLLLFFTLLAGIQGSFTVNAKEQSSHALKQEWLGKKEQNNQLEKLPRLKGGAENPERNQQQPVSNIELQKKYPKTVFLQGSSTAKRVAITFDDGPDPRFTEQVLDVLAQYKVPATFFVMGSRAIAFPEIVKRMNKEGHIIGNHTYWHPNLVKKGDVGTLETEVNRTEETLNNIIGYRPKLFRAPYGFLFEELVEHLAKKDYSVIAWSVDSLDWQEAPPAQIASTVVDKTHPGAIILMHDGGDWDADRTNTIKALHQIIPKLQEQGYEFVTVPQLLNMPYQR